MFKNNKGMNEEKLVFYRPIFGEYHISSPYGVMRGKHFHRGCDYVADEYRIIHAIGWSKVIRKGFQEHGAGNYLVLQSLWYNENYIEVKYFHLQEMFVEVGDIVQGKQPIGIEGNTGHSTGPHLHLEIWVDRKHRNPENDSLIKWINID